MLTFFQKFLDEIQEYERALAESSASGSGSIYRSAVEIQSGNASMDMAAAVEDENQSGISRAVSMTSLGSDDDADKIPEKRPKNK